MLIKSQSYSDLPFFISKNPFTNDFNIIKDVSAIRQSLKNIILTNNGERSFNYQFGGNLYSYLFENFSVDSMLRIRTNLMTNIKLYEPRVEVNAIDIEDISDENRINITINFGILDTEIVDTMTVSILRTR